jgi:hypothetical protein
MSALAGRAHRAVGAGLDIFETFIANAAFTAGMVIFEIPDGGADVALDGS